MYAVISLDQLETLEIVDIANLVRELPVEAGFATYQIGDFKPIPVVALAMFNNAVENNQWFLDRFCEIISRPVSLRLIPHEQGPDYLEWHYSK